MNRIFNKNSILRLTTVLGLTALCAGLFSQTPANADEDGRFGGYDRYHAPIRHEVNDIHRDEQRLRDLYNRRDSEARRHDWNDVHALNIQINELRRHIGHDRQEVHHDIQRVRSEQDWNRARYRDHDDYRAHDDYRYHEGR